MVKPLKLGNADRRGRRPPIIIIQYIIYSEDDKEDFEHVGPHAHPSTKIAY